MRDGTVLSPRSLGAVAMFAASLAYYALYISSGFNYADDGNYAQICYELFLGRSVNDLAVNYGVLWFKMGEALFHLFGVNYLLVKIFFFACIAVTNVLVFYTVALVSRSLLFATLLTAITALVPAFPATSFYGLCVMLNVAAQMRLACRLKTAAPRDMVIAGVALSLSFQIRPDFGYVFMFPLLILMGLAAVTSTAGGSVSARLRGFIAAAVAAFAVTLLPVVLLAFAGGYAGFVVRQFLEYPALIVEFLVGGLRRAFDGGAAVGHDLAAGTPLQRPGLRAMLRGEPGVPSLAMLIYLPVFGLIGFGLFNVHLLFGGRWRVQPERLGQGLVAVCAALATLPHYFLFRPDLPHIANFMAGYLVLVAVFACQAKSETNAAAWRWGFAAIMGLLFVGNLGLYVWKGLPSLETGSIGLATGRSEHFIAANGVHVTVAADEKAQLVFLKAVIEQNSKPGDSIVCLPYCPGLAFMTERRLLLRNFFADDSFLVRAPQWLPETIALTQAARPPVVIVMNWAINGTEISRFDNWAAPYVTALKGMARETIVQPGMTVYLLSDRPVPTASSL